jgi:hypothetical protein
MIASTPKTPHQITNDAQCSSTDGLLFKQIWLPVRIPTTTLQLKSRSPHPQRARHPLLKHRAPNLSNTAFYSVNAVHPITEGAHCSNTNSAHCSNTELPPIQIPQLQVQRRQRRLLHGDSTQRSNPDSAHRSSTDGAHGLTAVPQMAPTNPTPTAATTTPPTTIIVPSPAAPHYSQTHGAYCSITNGSRDSNTDRPLQHHQQHHSIAPLLKH